jgi:hypothetical protein
MERAIRWNFPGSKRTVFWLGAALAFTASLCVLPSQGRAAVRVGEFYSDDAASTSGNCTGSFCTVIFASLPPGKSLAITSAACKFTLQNGLAVREMRLYTLGAAGTFGTYLKPVVLSADSLNRFYQSDDVLLHLVPAGSQAGIVYSVSNGTASTTGVMRCHIAGLLRP